jgi:hypothetical protein
VENSGTPSGTEVPPPVLVVGLLDGDDAAHSGVERAAVGVFAGFGGAPGEGAAGADIAGIKGAAGCGDSVVAVVAVGPDNRITGAKGDLSGGEGSATNGDDDGRARSLGGDCGDDAKVGGGEGEEDEKGDAHVAG